jgi:hypothetical protein
MAHTVSICTKLSHSINCCNTNCCIYKLYIQIAVYTYCCIYKFLYMKIVVYKNCPIYKFMYIQISGIAEVTGSTSYEIKESTELRERKICKHSHVIRHTNKNVLIKIFLNLGKDRRPRPRSYAVRVSIKHRHNLGTQELSRVWPLQS